MAENTQLQTARDDAPSCIHHWILSDPTEGAVSGRCKRCGGERLFSARPEGADRVDDDEELTPRIGQPAERHARGTG